MVLNMNCFGRRQAEDMEVFEVQFLKTEGADVRVLIFPFESQYG
jgi:hypothetical protein